MLGAHKPPLLSSSTKARQQSSRSTEPPSAPCCLLAHCLPGATWCCTEPCAKPRLLARGYFLGGCCCCSVTIADNLPGCCQLFLLSEYGSAERKSNEKRREAKQERNGSMGSRASQGGREQSPRDQAWRGVGVRGGASRGQSRTGAFFLLFSPPLFSFAFSFLLSQRATGLLFGG